MTSEEFVKEKYPRAVVVHYKTRDVFDKKGYYLCWTKGYQGERLSEGTSKSNAWKNAKERILETEQLRTN